MKEIPRKEQIRNTHLNKLGLGGRFDWWFCDKKMKQDEVILVREIIVNNPYALTKREPLVIWKNDKIKKILQHRKFSMFSKSWKKLEDFLLAEDFTNEDWILLPPKEGYTALNMDSGLDKISISQITYLRQNTGVCWRIRQIVFEDSEKTVSIQDFLNLSFEDTRKILKGNRHYKRAFVYAQGVFRENSLHGSFMDIKFPKGRN